MSVDNTALYVSYTNMFRQANISPAFFSYDLEFIVAGRVIKCLTVSKLSLVCDYVNNYTDLVTAEVSMGMGDYIRYIYPNRKDLKVCLYRHPVNHRTGIRSTTTAIGYQEFVGVLKVARDVNAESGGDVGSNYEECNQTSIYNFTVQLIDPIIANCRGVEIADVVNGQDRTALLASVMSSLPDVKGVSVVEPDVKEPLYNTVIPSGIALTDFPTWLQNQGGGVYNTGIGYYLRRGFWHIYPLYNTARFDKADRVLTICNVPSSRMPSVEKTFIETEKELYILATGDLDFRDLTDELELNDGDGVRFAKADGLTARDGQIDPNTGELSLDRKNRMVEVAGSNRNIAYTKVTPTNNFSAELSKIASRRGIVVSVDWQNSAIGRIEPGMAVRLMFNRGNKVMRLEGVVLSTYTDSLSLTKGVLNNAHQCATKISLFLNRGTEGILNDY